MGLSFVIIDVSLGKTVCLCQDGDVSINNICLTHNISLIFYNADCVTTHGPSFALFYVGVAFLCLPILLIPLGIWESAQNEILPNRRG